MNAFRAELRLGIQHIALMAAAPRAMRRLERMEVAMLGALHRYLSAAPALGRRQKRSVKVSSSK